MKIKKLAIVGAMDSEILYLKEKMEASNITTKEENGFIFYEGKLFDKDIILVKSGVGRAASAILFTTLSMIYKDIDLIINVGIAGGYSGTSVGDIVVGKVAVYGDADLTAFSKYVYGQMSSCPPYFDGDEETISKILKSNLDYKIGTICTNEKFMTDYNYATSLINSFFKDLNVLAFDMESAAFAQCAYLLNKRFIAIRAISDVIGDNDQVNNYKMSFEEMSIKSNIFLYNLIELI